MGYVDLLAVQGNDGEPQQEPPVYEGAFEDLQSKKKAVRRENFADTDNNSADAQAVDYSDPVDGAQGPHNSQMEQGSGDQEPTTPADTYRTGSFEQGAGLTLELLNSVGIGQADPDGGVAEIVAYNADRSQAYVVNGKDGLLYTLDLGTEGLTVAGSLDVRTLVEGFTYGDMTSVAVDSVNDHIAVALQSQDYAANGRVLLLNYNMELLASYEVGVQPDMVTFTPDGSKILTANEGEPREGYGNGAVDPEGSVTIIDLEDGTVTTAGFAAFDAQTLVQEGILIGKVDGQLNEAAADLEPEYIAVSADGSRAYVTLQEANAIATVDLESKEILSVKSLGFQDLSQGERAIDLVEDGAYLPKTYEDAVGVYMPDGIAAYEVNGITYLVTANEGDAREWGDYCNEIEETLTATDGTVAQEVRVLDQDLVAVPDSTKAYLYGGRSFSIYRADTMEQVYDSANDFEALTAQYLPDWFNCSNDDIDVDSRSPKKGPEAESVTLGQVGNKFYAFVALERIGGVMVYDVTDPAKVQFVNYINTRDFAGEVQGDVAPEGLAFLPASVTATGKPMLLAACEVSGTVAVYTMDGPATEIPTPEEPDDDPQPGGDGTQDDEEPGVPQNPNTADGFGLWAGLTALAGSLAGMGLFARRKRRVK